MHVGCPVLDAMAKCSHNVVLCYSGMLQNMKKLDRETTASYSVVVAVKDSRDDRVRFTLRTTCLGK